MNIAESKEFLSESDSGLATIKMICGMYHQLTSILDPEIINVSGKSYKKSSPKACFANSEQYVDNHDSIYVLGFLLFQGIPIEHAWIREGSEYYDVTLGGTSDTEVYVKCIEISSSDLASYTEKYRLRVKSKSKKPLIGYIDLSTLARSQ